MNILLRFVFISTLSVIDARLPPDDYEDSHVQFIAHDRNQAMVKLNIVRNGTCEVCSGSFIDPEWILTSAHCVHDAQSLTADVGLHVNSSCGKSYTLRTADIIVHPSFNTTYDDHGHVSKRSHDIALIKFNEKTSCERIWLALLPKENANRNSYIESYVELKRFQNSCNTSLPKLADIKWNLWVTKHTSCSSGYTNVGDPIERNLDQEQICVFRPYWVHICALDPSGHIFKENSALLVGIMADVANNCYKGNEFIFTAVSYYVTWIKSHIPHLRTEP